MLVENIVGLCQQSQSDHFIIFDSFKEIQQRFKSLIYVRTFKNNLIYHVYVCLKTPQDVSGKQCWASTCCSSQRDGKDTGCHQCSGWSWWLWWWWWRGWWWWCSWWWQSYDIIVIMMMMLMMKMKTRGIPMSWVSISFFSLSKNRCVLYFRHRMKIFSFSSHGYLMW